MSLTLVLLVRIPAEGVTSFRAYEDAVLPLLGKHGGRLERRLRTCDGRTEVHLVAFDSAESFTAFRVDPERLRHQHLLVASGATSELLDVTDV